MKLLHQWLGYASIIGLVAFSSVAHSNDYDGTVNIVNDRKICTLTGGDRVVTVAISTTRSALLGGSVQKGLTFNIDPEDRRDKRLCTYNIALVEGSVTEGVTMRYEQTSNQNESTAYGVIYIDAVPADFWEGIEYEDTKTFTYKLKYSLEDVAVGS